MPRAAANGIEIEYDTFGEATNPALLLVMGFTAQLIAWYLRRAVTVMERIGFSPAELRKDLAGPRSSPAYLYTAAELINHAAEMDSQSVNRLEDEVLALISAGQIATANAPSSSITGGNNDTTRVTRMFVR